MKHHSKNKINKKITSELEAREEQIINLVFMEFMRCLKPKPLFLPLVLLWAFVRSLFAPKKTWEWFTRRFVYDLSRAERMEPGKVEAIQKDVLDGIERIDPARPTPERCLRSAEEYTGGD